MKKFFFFSFTAHGLFFGALVALGTLLSRPPMSYYSVDLVSALPSGSTASPAPVAPTPVPEAPKVTEPPTRAPVVPKNVPREAIKVVDKSPKKPPLPHAPAKKPAPKAPTALPSWAVADNPEANTNSTASPLGSNASTVSAKTGQPFPFPWYLKVVYSRLEKAWRPPDESLTCVVSFVIARSGEVSNVRVTRSSGDPFFDQVAEHAVNDSNPMPPLPTAYPEPVLNVHMTFDRPKI